jgi:pimeloyl-ACP methyl ester carboxylesterase
MRRERWGMTARIGLLGTVAVTLAVAGLLPPAISRAAQKADKPDDLPVPEFPTLRTADELNLHVTYYKSTREKDAAVVVLLHMKDGTRLVWTPQENGFARELQKKGYAVIAVDLRFHGENKAGGAVPAANPNQTAGKKKGKKAAGLDLKQGDYLAMVESDMEAVKAFIFDEHQAGRLNMNKMAIVGPEMGASIAAAYALYDWMKEPYDDGQPGFQTPRGQDVRALVLISPEETYHNSNIRLSKILTALKDPDKNIAILICAGNDPKEDAQAKKIFDMANPSLPNNKEKERLNSDRMYLKSFPAKLMGTDLLGQRLQIEDFMLAFFDKHLQTVDSPWRDRQNKREKKRTK